MYSLPELNYDFMSTPASPVEHFQINTGNNTSKLNNRPSVKKNRSLLVHELFNFQKRPLKQQVFRNSMTDARLEKNNS